MAFKSFPVAAAAALGLFLAACAPTTGRIEGVVQGPDGLSQGPVQMTYVQLPSGGESELAAMLPDGEKFTGKGVRVAEESRGSSVSFGFGGGFGWGGGFGSSVIAPYDQTTYTGELQAQLFGDRGRTMACRFQAARPSAGFDGGGIGNCRISDGRQIAARF
ncbi:hypothetical protein [Zavarzinia sp. CC-PAN008]|uniref:hypothetical protein n=1 Tax=Zavarzinia sp. CC-PAN008 TaxID=3243332 RepID=UPI003F743A8B